MWTHITNLSTTAVDMTSIIFGINKNKLMICLGDRIELILARYDTVVMPLSSINIIIINSKISYQ